MPKVHFVRDSEDFSLRDFQYFITVIDINAELTSESIKIGGSNDKSEEEKLRWINQNNYLIDVSNVRVKPGTDWSDGE